MAMNILDHDDGIIDQNTDGKNQRKQRYAVKRKSPRPRCEQRRRQREYHGGTDDGRFATAERQEHQRDHRGGREQQFGDELFRFVVGGGAVVAGFGDLDIGGNDGVLEQLHAAHDGVGYVDGVFAGLLGDGNRDCGILGAVFACNAVPYIAASGRRAIAHGGNIAQKYGLPATYAHDEVGQVLRAFEKWPRFDRDRAIAREQIARRHAGIGRLQCRAQIGDGNAATRHARRIDLDHDRATGSADGAHLARAGDTFQICFHAVRDALEVERACGLAVQRQPDDRHVVDSLRLDQRLQYTEPFG